MSNRKTINIGRVKGSMVYTGVDFQVENPLEGDLYLHNIEYAFYQYVAGNWVKITDFEEHSIKAETLRVGNSTNYNIESDEEILTAKAIVKIINESTKVKAKVENNTLFLSGASGKIKIENNTLYL